MKKFVMMALVAVFTLGFTLEAQENQRGSGQRPPGGQRVTAKEQAETMAKQLKLTADEKTKVEALLKEQEKSREERMAKMREERDGQTQNRDQLREEMQAQREKEQVENDAKLEKIIGKEKTEQWKKYRSEQQKEMRNNPDRQRRQDS